MALLLVLVALAAGAGLAPQAAANAAMARVAGRPEWAAIANFSVGLAGLVGLVLATRLPWPAPAALGRAPWWAWGGGFLGAFYVAAVAFLAPRIGVATTLSLAVTGQTLAALALDHLGALGMAARPITGPRALGAVLLVAGVVLIRRF
jgi:transporter family-2 protein